MALVTRFAPSPTGRLHIGNAYSALLAFDAARETGGRFLLRIEDIDTGRCRPEFEAGILEDLAWLGLAWEQPVHRQSEHFPAFADALGRLQQLGVIYRCFRTRRELAEAAASAPHGDPGTAATVSADRFVPLSPQEEQERLARGESFAWRLSVAASAAHLGEEFASLAFEEQGLGPNGERGRITARPEHFSDVILARKDAPASYHLAVTHDDAMQGVTHVVRGADLFGATFIHTLLQRLLGWPTPIYRHHRLILREDGKRFAKRDRDATLASLRAEGVTPAQIRSRLGLPPP